MTEISAASCSYWPNCLNRDYRVVGPLGRGGRAVVVEAESVGGERVAVKLPLLDGIGVDPASARRILACEGHLLSRMSHPGIVALRDFGRDGSYLILELLSNQPLSERFKGRRASVREALSITTSLAAALAAMHCAGIAHLDLKPRNVLARKPGAGEPVIVDLGSARPLEKPIGPGTISPRKLGSGKYLFNAPEQILGGVEYFTPATDAFALGSVLFWLLTGDCPYSNLSSTHSSAWASYRAEYETAKRTCGGFDLPDPAAGFLRQALAVDQDARPQCLTDVASTLRGCADLL